MLSLFYLSHTLAASLYHILHDIYSKKEKSKEKRRKTDTVADAKKVMKSHRDKIVRYLGIRIETLTDR